MQETQQVRYLDRVQIYYKLITIHPKFNEVINNEPWQW